MNFYKHHIGDYAKKTGHLSIAEHGAYLLMMQTFYATEKPLPTGRTLYRLLRAESKADRDAIDSVVRQFWRETADGLTNDRAERELRADRIFIEKQRASGRASAAKRWTSQKGNGGYNGGYDEPIDSVTTKNQPPTPTPTPTPNSRQSEGDPPPAQARPKPKAARRCPPEFPVDLAFAVTEIPDIDPEREAAKFKDCEFKNPHTDWSATWRNWVRTAKDRGNYARKQTKPEIVWSRVT